MNKHVLFAAVAATLFAAPVHAIKINDQAMAANGGTMANIQGTAPNVFDTLRTASNASQFDAVGRIGDCTGTWLGTEGDYAWVLTAARCVRNTNLVGAADHLTFTNKNGVALAGGEGSTSYIHPKRINRPTSVRDAGTDIALVRMKRLPASNTAAPAAPVLYDAKAEAGVSVGFVAYGSAFVNNTNVNAVWPTEGERRAWGESKLDGVTENGHALFANYTGGSTTNWAGVTTSDAGSAWWQEHNGQWQIVATTSGGTAVQSHGARVSTYATWIKDLFPNVKVSNGVGSIGVGPAEITTSKTSYAWSTPTSAVYFVGAPNQPGVVAPTDQVWGSNGTTRLVVPVRNARTGQTSTVELRGRRSNGCSWHEMNSRIVCGGQYVSQLMVSYDAATNAGLTPGIWSGRVVIEAKSWNAGQAVIATHEIDVEIEKATPKVTEKDAVATDSLGAGIAFTIPTQPTASGPTSLHSASTTTGISTITVQARDAVTQTIVPIKLRAQRNNGCNDIAMNNATNCGQTTSILKVSFDPTDNPALAAGRYSATFNVQAAVIGNTGSNKTLPIELDLNFLP